MTVNPLLSAVSATLAQQSVPVSVTSQVAAATDSAVSPTTDVTDSSPSQSVLQSASLLTASSNFAQLGSLLEVAQSGTEQVGTILAQLQSLAQQATAPAAGTDLTGLDNEFQQVLSQIDQTVGSTTFGGSPLLNGSFSGGDANGQTPSLSLPDLSTQGLFGSQQPDISTPQDAQAALASIAQAQTTVDNTGTSISSVFGQLSFAAASVDSALANGTAASSTLSDEDLADGTGSGDLASLLSQSPQAQTGNINGSLLSLLQD